MSIGCSDTTNGGLVASVKDNRSKLETIPSSSVELLLSFPLEYQPLTSNVSYSTKIAELFNLPGIWKNFSFSMEPKGNKTPIHNLIASAIPQTISALNLCCRSHSSI